jgi:hypothetical protein
VDFDENRAKELVRKLPKGMGKVLGVWVGTIETGEVFGPNGETVRIIVDRIEKIEQKEQPRANHKPDWLPKDCRLRNH